ncbi:MAG: ParB/RepB/Spo0J family partition protein [Lachnospiraceae bacterium]|nr:ParB/RepB/Spo0J family partition protein [Lachnospiraceae bacterium]
MAGNKKNISDAESLTTDIQVKRILSFKDHPFKVIDDENMLELVTSIKTYGIITPVLVRPIGKDCYEMISGHRRLHASELAGLDTIPAIVKNMTDDEAIIAMVNGNVQRENILPSERAFSLKMKWEAIKRQGERTDLNSTSGTECQKLEMKSVGEIFGLKDRQVRKYIRLTELIPELLQLIDERRLGISMGADISFFDKEVQKWLYEYRIENGFLKPSQIEELKRQPNLENMTQYTVIRTINDVLPMKQASGKVTLSEKKLKKFFPSHMSACERERIIITLLENWKKEGQNL